MHRRLPEAQLRLNIYKVGTSAAGARCYQISVAATEADLSSADCRATGQTCSGCFITTDTASDKVLEAIQCSSAMYGTLTIASTYAYELQPVNSDAGNCLAIKACADAFCLLWKPLLRTATAGLRGAMGNTGSSSRRLLSQAARSPTWAPFSPVPSTASPSQAAAGHSLH